MADEFKLNATDMPELIAIGMARLLTAMENAEMDTRKWVVVNVGMEPAVGLGLRLIAVRAQRTLIYNLNYNVIYTSSSAQYNTYL